jgi:general stress protein CsbA
VQRLFTVDCGGNGTIIMKSRQLRRYGIIALLAIGYSFLRLSFGFGHATAGWASVLMVGLFIYLLISQQYTPAYTSLFFIFALDLISIVADFYFLSKLREIGVLMQDIETTKHAGLDPLYLGSKEFLAIGHSKLFIVIDAIRLLFLFALTVATLRARKDGSEVTAWKSEKTLDDARLVE